MLVGHAYDTNSRRLFFNQVPDLVHKIQKGRITLHRQGSGPFKRHVEHRLDTARPGAHHDHPVCEVHGLVNLMGDEEHRLLLLGPDQIA